MTNKLKLPKYSKEFKEKRLKKQLDNAKVEEQMHRAFLKKLNKANGIGVKRK